MTSPPSSSDGAPPSSSFERLHEKVQRWIWEKNWRELRDVQDRAIPPILEGRDDVILAAATAGGKTEAAFLPIVSQLVGTKISGVSCLYVSPLKALINDQYGRIGALGESLEIPVHRWHGDVSADHKREVLRDPAGILLITPESIEAMMVLRGTTIPGIFAGLRYVVIDELHSFLGSERGRQLQSLLHRIEHAIRRRVPRIGLSATLGDMGLAAEFIRPGGAAGVHLIVDAGGEGQELRMQMLGYRIPAMPPDITRAGEAPRRAMPGESDRNRRRSEDRSQGLVDEGIEESDEGEDGDDVEEEGKESVAVQAVCQHLYRHLRGTDNLIFANSRSRVEDISDRLRCLSEAAGVPNEFLPHHGSLSRAFREEVEERLKEGTLPLTAVCTSTLEMGIDIGSVTSVAQVGAPPAVASLRQRLGRSGRRGDPAILRVYCLEDEQTPRIKVSDALRAETMQTVAMIELLLERWCEPPESGTFHYSTLVQQVLSMIAQYGGFRAQDAWQVLCGDGPFANIDGRRFAAVLRRLGEQQIITQMNEGTIVIGAVGEKLVNHYQFYTAFTSTDEYRLVHGTQTLGQLPVSYPIQVDMHIVFAGRRWRIAAIDTDARTIQVVPSAGGRAPRFSGAGGFIHDRVRRKMFDMYRSDAMPAYLAASARELVREGRTTFVRLGLAGTRIVKDGRMVTIFPWAGDRVMNTIALVLAARGLEAGLSGIAVEISGSCPGEVRRHLGDFLRSGRIDTIALAKGAKDVAREKYDHLVPEDLAAEDFAMRRLDGPETLDAIREIMAVGDRGGSSAGGQGGDDLGSPQC
jgi:ATP-dependent helicase Lhr and Lhr-like helicase